jgi:predicted aspartyl protease
VIIGRFGDTSGRPFVEGHFLLPSQNLRGNISFLVDTGTDLTMIMPDDSQRLGIDLDNLSGQQETTGIGGRVETALERALITFHEPNSNKLRLYNLDLDFIYPNSYTRNMPSILGRDIIDRWRINYDPSKDKLTFTVRSADLTA